MIEIAGLTPFTTVDYPGKLSAVIFCQGCPWKCGYCHNPHLQPFGKGSMNWEVVLDFLQKRKGFLDAVVFSGGEPSLQRNLSHAMAEVKRLGYKIGLHTAGIHPQTLKPLIPFIDWVGMDIKAPFEDYEKITKAPQSGEKVRDSITLIVNAKVDYEFRTTVHPNLLSPDDINRMADQLVEMGAKHYVLQKFRPNGCNDENLVKTPFDIIWSEPFLLQLKGKFESFFVR